MYYYCKRTTMSASAAWPRAEGPQSCCGEGGGGGELVNGNGGEIIGARAVSEWESATCDPANATRSACTDSTFTRDRGDGAARGLCRCCRLSGARGGGGDIDIDGENGSERCPRCMGQTGTAAAPRGERETGPREFRNSVAAVSQPRGCGYSGASKRACFSGTSTAEEAGFHCGEVTVQNTARGRRRQRGVFSKGAEGDQSLSLRREMKGAGGVNNGEWRGCGTAKGRVRFHRGRSFQPSTERRSANGVSVAQLSKHGHGEARPQQTTQFSASSSSCVAARADEAGSGKGRPAVNGGPLRQVEAAKLEAKKRQLLLGERTDTLWRRLHAVQVKQVERHVTQQLGDLGRAAVGPSTAELRRLARSCSEALRTAGGALDSDHTASSSGGGSDTEEDEDEDGGRGERHVSASRVKSVHMSRDRQWMSERAWLGSRWVWLQAQVSELECGIRALTELYTHLRQAKVSQVRGAHSAPETPLRAPRASPAPQECSFRKWLVGDSTPLSQTPSGPTSSAARVRPLLRRCHHRLIRWEGLALGSKEVTVPCGCEPPAACVLYGPPHPPAEDVFMRQMCRKRLDLHPVLSMPSDFGPELCCVTSPPGAQHSHAMGRRGPRQQKDGETRRRLPCPCPPGTLASLFITSGVSNCRGQWGVVNPGQLHQLVTDLSYLSGVATHTDTPTQPLRRRRGESSFDIDHLVMPHGLAGLGTRVQKLQYKEIITPSWRELDSVWGVSERHAGSGEVCVIHSGASQRNEGEEQEHKGEVEDLTDAVFLKRHAVWESRERSRWGGWSHRRHRGRFSSSPCWGDGRRCWGTEWAWCSPEPRQGKSSACSCICSAADEPLYQTEDEQRVLFPWERRSFPLLEEELRWLWDDEEAELEEDACGVSGRSQSTDSGISVGSLELSPRTPQPHPPHSGGRPLAVIATQDTKSTLPSLTPPPLSSLPLPSDQQNPSDHRGNNEPAPLHPQTSHPA